jgi:hypothetical protein
MAPASRRFARVRDAIEVVLRRLAALPSSMGVVELRSTALEHLREVDGWSTSAPTVEERERLMKSVLSLHMAVAKLERHGP